MHRGDVVTAALVGCHEILEAAVFRAITSAGATQALNLTCCSADVAPVVLCIDEVQLLTLLHKGNAVLRGFHAAADKT